jgi:hypothetical protein
MSIIEDPNEVISAQAQQEIEAIKEQITEGIAAKELLDNKFLQKWLKDSQGVLFDVLDTIPLNDNAARQRAMDLIYIFRKFEATFKEYIEVGEAAQGRWQEIIGGDKKKGLLTRIFDI